MNTGFIGSNLRLARLFHDLSLTELGDKVGVSKQFLSRIETGRANPTLNAMEVIAVALGMDVFELFERMRAMRAASVA